MTPSRRRPASVLLLAAVLLWGCGSSRPTPSPTQVPEPTSPTVSPKGTTPTPPAISSAASVPPGGPTDPLLNAVVVTVSDRVRVRSEPRVSDDSIKYEPVLPLGTQLLVLDGPVSASGYTWYKVAPVSFEGLEGPGHGWVALAGKDGEPWIATCPPRPDLAALASMGSNLGLACYGDQEITFMARLAPFDGLACPDAPGFDWWIEPFWLGPCNFDVFLTPLEGEPNYDFSVKLHPAIDRGTLPAYFDDLGNSTWTTVEVTGQYNHPKARTCRGKGEQPPKPEAVVLECRGQFVVASIHVVDKQ